MRAWESFVEEQENELGKETVQKWLKSFKVLRYDACNLYLEAKDAFQVLWFEEHIRPKAQTNLVNNNKKRIKVHVTVGNLSTKAKGQLAKDIAKVESQQPKFVLSFDELDPYCTFSNFVVSDANQLTTKVFEQIANPELHKAKNNNGGSAVNPIYVHGGCGSGKTHLLMATAQVLRQKGLHVIYVRAQSFTDHVVSAIRAGEMSIFRQSYRNSDVLIIDDVHVFSRKGATQEEFFHTFNTLHLSDKPIILSANCAPGDLQLIEPRLVSRFEWGIVLSLETSGREEMARILAAKAGLMNFSLPAKVAEFLLHSFANTKSLNKALEALILRLHMNANLVKSTGLTVTITKQLLNDLLLDEKEGALTVERIIRGVAEFYGIRPEDLLGKSQTRDCVLPRQISMHLCRNQLKLPFIKIGQFFNKDHSTVMSSVKLIQQAIEADDAEIAGAYRTILKKMKDSQDETS